MSVTIPSVDANTDTFSNWLSITNQVAQTISNSVVTANTSEGVTGTVGSPVKAKIFGTYIANTIHVRDTITTNTTSYNVALEAINLDLRPTSKLYTTGELHVKNTFTIDTTSKVQFSDMFAIYGSTSGWLRANTTGYLYFSNLSVKGMDFDPSEFSLTSNFGYATGTNTVYDVVSYDGTKWSRTTLSHLAAVQVDTLTLGNVVANTSSNLIKVWSNTHIGQGTAALFIDTTNSRVGIKTASPQTALHVNGAIYATGDVTAFYTSDERLKTNIVKIESPLDKIKWINGVTFSWDTEKLAALENVGPKPENDIGVLAQQVEKVFPQAVMEREDGYKAVDYSRLVPVLIEAVKELSHRINILEAELDARYYVSER